MGSLWGNFASLQVAVGKMGFLDPGDNPPYVQENQSRSSAEDPGSRGSPTGLAMPTSCPGELGASSPSSIRPHPSRLPRSWMSPGWFPSHAWFPSFSCTKLLVSPLSLKLEWVLCGLQPKNHNWYNHEPHFPHLQNGCNNLLLLVLTRSLWQGSESLTHCGLKISLPS